MPTNGLLPPDVSEIHGEADDGEEEVQVAAPRLPLSVFCSIISFMGLARLKTLRPQQPVIQLTVKK